MSKNSDYDKTTWFFASVYESYESQSFASAMYEYRFLDNFVNRGLYFEKL